MRRCSVWRETLADVVNRHLTGAVGPGFGWLVLAVLVFLAVVALASASYQGERDVRATLARALRVEQAFTAALRGRVVVLERDLAASRTRADRLRRDFVGELIQAGADLERAERFARRWKAEATVLAVWYVEGFPRLGKQEQCRRAYRRGAGANMVAEMLGGVR